MAEKSASSLATFSAFGSEAAFANSHISAPPPVYSTKGMETYGNFRGAATSVAAPSALHPSPRRSAAAAPGPVKTPPRRLRRPPHPNHRRGGVRPRRRPGGGASSDAAAAKGWRPFQRAACSSMHGQLQQYISRGRAGWVEINSSIYVHLVVEAISFWLLRLWRYVGCGFLFRPK